MRNFLFMSLLAFMIPLSALAQSSYSSANQNSVYEEESYNYESGYINDAEYSESDDLQEEQYYFESEPVAEEEYYLEDLVYEEESSLE